MKPLRIPNLSLQTKFVLALGSVVLALVVILFLWTSQRIERQIMDQVDKQAKILWTQVVLTREWVAENRDVVSDVPAVVTKKLSKKAEQEGIYRFHITSLRLINPENAPNSFEREALQEFNKGASEVSRVEDMDGVKMYRYMAPLYVTEACLQCHEYQGYKVGDVRGGLSIMIPMQEADDAIDSNRQLLVEYSGLLLAVLLGALFLLVRRLVLGPVRHLHNVALEIEAGNYGVRSRVVTGDELERLGHAFNRMMAAIAETKNFNEAVLKNVASGVVAVDLQGHLTLVNKSADELFGVLRRDEVVRLKRELMSNQPLSVSRESGSTHAMREMRLKRKDGKRLLVSVTTSPLRNGEGEIVGSVGVIADVTELRFMDEQKANLDRLAALGQLAGSIAHEINNPLQGILSGLGLVADEECDPEQRREYSIVIREEVERIARTIQQMLDFYRPSLEGGAPTDLNALISSVLSLVRKQLQNNRITLELSLDPGLQSVMAIGSQVRQVVLNIVLNAIEAMPSGGQLRVSTRIAEAGEDGGVDSIAIEVADTGVGMPRRQLSRIFDPFYTTKPKGTGLGLSVSHGIVKAHGGVIKADSHEGVGSTFIVVLPVLGPCSLSGDSEQTSEVSDALASTSSR